MKTIIVIVSVILVSACSSSRITSSWKAPGTSPRMFNKILVLGLINDKDLGLRQDMETQMVDDLKSLGYAAVSALDEYGPKTFTGMKEEEALSKIKNSGVDAVITVVMLDKSQEKEYVPAHIYYSPYVLYHNHFWGYYTTMRMRIYEPGYYQENTKYFWESNFYTMDDGKRLIYSVQTRSFNPGSAMSLAHEYGKLIVNNLQEKGVIVKGNQLALK
ncbi:MAG TPA: hypothetical protein VF145_10635 [Chitinophagaceae bacterium]